MKLILKLTILARFTAASMCFSPMEQIFNPVRKWLFNFLTVLPLLHPWAYLAILVIITARMVHSWVRLLIFFFP